MAAGVSPERRPWACVAKCCPPSGTRIGTRALIRSQWAPDRTQDLVAMRQMWVDWQARPGHGCEASGCHDVRADTFYPSSRSPLCARSGSTTDTRTATPVSIRRPSRRGPAANTIARSRRLTAARAGSAESGGDRELAAGGRVRSARFRPPRDAVVATDAATFPAFRGSTSAVGAGPRRCPVC
jgi:hypothetical protein